MLAKNIKVLIIHGLGIGCHEESKQAYLQSGVQVDLIHFNQLLESKEKLANYQIINIAGGFMHGDLLGSAMCAVNQLNIHGLTDSFWDFSEKGGVIYGQCNGFQLLVKSGLLPAADGNYSQQLVTLAHNDCGSYRVAYVPHRLKNKHFAFAGLEDQVFHLWCRHGEGKLQFNDQFSTLGQAKTQTVDQIMAEHVLLEYANPETGKSTEEFPHNPNGSYLGIAGLKSSNGRIFGQMAHPEVSVFDFTDPQVFEKKEALKRGVKTQEKLVGKTIINNLVNYFA